MSERTVHFYFDYISPYAYVAWTQIGELATRHNFELKPTPVLFAGLLNAQGNLGPAEIPAKRLYVFRNAQRLAQDFGLPFCCPPTHPFNPLLPLRISGAIEEPALQAKIISTFFDAVWGQGNAIDTPDAVRRVLSEAGFTPEVFIQQASDPVIKIRLNQHTSEAVARGAFGVPTAVVDDELFWGVDALPHLERYLRGEQQLDETQMQCWHDVPATAGRTRKDLSKVSLMKDT